DAPEGVTRPSQIAVDDHSRPSATWITLLPDPFAFTPDVTDVTDVTDESGDTGGRYRAQASARSCRPYPFPVHSPILTLRRLIPYLDRIRDSIRASRGRPCISPQGASSIEVKDSMIDVVLIASWSANRSRRSASSRIPRLGVSPAGRVT